MHGTHLDKVYPAVRQVRRPRHLTSDPWAACAAQLDLADDGNTVGPPIELVTSRLDLAY